MGVAHLLKHPVWLGGSIGTSSQMKIRFFMDAMPAIHRVRVGDR